MKGPFKIGVSYKNCKKQMWWQETGRSKEPRVYRHRGTWQRLHTKTKDGPNEQVKQRHYEFQPAPQKTLPWETSGTEDQVDYSYSSDIDGENPPRRSKRRKNHPSALKSMDTVNSTPLLHSRTSKSFLIWD